MMMMDKNTNGDGEELTRDGVCLREAITGLRDYSLVKCKPPGDPDQDLSIGVSRQSHLNGLLAT